MAYPRQRSCNSELHAGMTDGGWKKFAPNRGGSGIEYISAAMREHMSGAWHGFNESAEKCLPDGRSDHPPYYAYITPEDNENI